MSKSEMGKNERIINYLDRLERKENIQIPQETNSNL